MRRFSTVFFVFLALSFCASARPSIVNSSMVDSLRIALDKLDENYARRVAALEKQKNQYLISPVSRQRVTLAESLAKQYMVQNIDTAVMYYRLAIKDAESLGASDDALRASFTLNSILPIVGITKEAIDWYESINYATVPYELRRHYWLSGAEIYHVSQTPYPPGEYKEHYNKLTIVALDSLKHYYPQQSPLVGYLTGYIHLLRGESNLAVANFIEVLPKLTDYPELADFTMKAVVDYYRVRPEYRQVYIAYLFRRAISALKRGVVLPEALAALGAELVAEGYEDMGRRCVSLALRTPDMSYRASLVTFDRSGYAHYLTDEVSSRNRAVAKIIMFLLVLLSAVVGYAIYCRKRVRYFEKEVYQAEERIKGVEKEAARTTRNVIALAFLAFEHMRDYNVYVLRKLKAGQVKDLYEDAENGKFIQRQSEKYFEEFDASFLANFPNFVGNLNMLLQPDKQLSLLPGDRLSPELRIAAFMRLGINDSNRLAQIMSLSLNTIYTYRNRLRGRAIDRENFEKNLIEST